MAISLDYSQPPAEYALCKDVQFEFDRLVDLTNTELGNYAPVGATYVTLSTNSSLTNERVLTGTSNQIVVTDNGAGSTVVLSTPQNIHTAATPTFASETLTATSNQLILGATRTVTLTAPTPASSSRTITFPDLATNYDVVGASGTQTIGGSKTFSSDVTITSATSTAINISASNSGGILGSSIDNTSNTSGSEAREFIRVAGGTAGDPYTVYSISGVLSVSIGIDNSDSDKFKISGASTLGTTDLLSIAVGTLAATFGGALSVPSGSNLYLDGGSDTYIQEGSSNIISIVAGGTTELTITSTDVYTEGWTDWSSTAAVTGWSSASVKKVFYKRYGKTVMLWWDLEGTSNSTSFSMTIPFTRSTDSGFTMIGPIGAIDATAAVTTGPIWQINSAGTSIIFSKDALGTGWTNSGSKRAYGQCLYQSA